MSTVGMLRGVLRRHLLGSGTLTLDLEGLTFTDSNGIATFIDISRQLGPGDELILLSPRRQVARLLDLTGIAEGLPNITIVGNSEQSGSPPQAVHGRTTTQERHGTTTQAATVVSLSELERSLPGRVTPRRQEQVDAHVPSPGTSYDLPFIWLG